MLRVKTQKLLKDLVGVWTLERTIKPGGVMVGQAEFKPVSDTEYHYIEQGSLTLDHGEEIKDVKRAHIYKLEKDTIQIYYADGPDNGKLFQVLEFTSDTEAQAEHLCRYDLYESAYSFALPAEFTVRHAVKGPKKDYVSKTKYSKSS